MDIRHTKLYIKKNWHKRLKTTKEVTGYSIKFYIKNYKIGHKRRVKIKTVTKTWQK